MANAISGEEPVGSFERGNDLVAIPGRDGRLNASRTAELEDAGLILFSSGASAINYTIPPDSIIRPFLRGATITICNEGAGIVTLVPGSGVTINSLGGSLVSAGQYAMFAVRKTTANVWIAYGNLTT